MTSSRGSTRCAAGMSPSRKAWVARVTVSVRASVMTWRSAWAAGEKRWPLWAMSRACWAMFMAWSPMRSKSVTVWSHWETQRLSASLGSEAESFTR